MGIGNAINTAREAANTITPSAEGVKAAALNTCRGAIDTCKGSGSVTTELKKAISTAVNVPVGMATNSLKACTQLLTLQPVQATCTVAKGLKDACVDTAKFVASPVALTSATAQTGVRVARTGARATKEAVIKAASLPVAAPLLAYNKLGDLIIGAENAIGLGDSAGAAPANDNAEKHSAAEPPMAQAA